MNTISKEEAMRRMQQFQFLQTTTQNQVQGSQPMGEVFHPSNEIQKPTPQKISKEEAQRRMTRSSNSWSITQRPSFSEKAAGFFGGLVKGIAKPFVTAGVTGLSAAQGASNFIAGTAGKAVGADEFAEKRFAEADRVLTEGYNVPGFGQVKPVGADIGQEDGIKKELGRMIGTGAEIASTLAGGAGVKDVVKEGAKGAAKQAIKIGAKEGALAGAAGGFGTGVQEEDASLLSVAGSTASGAAFGAAAGATGGAISPKLTKAGRAAQKAQKVEEAALEIVMPKQTAKVAQEALEESRVVEKGIGPFKTEVIEAGPREKEMAKAVANLVKVKARPNENIKAIRKEIGRISEEEIRPYLKANDAIFNENIINSRLRKLETPDLFKADPTMEKTYNLVRQRAMDVIKKNKKNMTGLLDARQEFDRLVDKEFPRLYESERDTVIKRAITDMRNEMNDFIADSLPDGATMFKDKLRQQSLMYEAVENIAEKGRGEIGTSKIQRFGKKHPRLKQAAQIGGSVAIGAQGYDLLKGD